MGDIDEIQNELEKHISDNKSNWNLLPNEIWLKIIRAELQHCDFKANHMFDICDFESEKQKI